MYPTKSFCCPGIIDSFHIELLKLSGKNLFFFQYLTASVIIVNLIIEIRDLMNVWLCYQMYKNNFLNTFLTPFVDSRWFFSTFWRWRSIFLFDVLLKSTQRWECELLQEHVHTQTHAPETFQNLDKYDYRWQEDFTWYAGCCSAVMRTHPAELGAFQLWHLVFFWFFFKILFTWPQAHKMTPAASAKPYMFDNWTRNHTHCQFKH